VHLTFGAFSSRGSCGVGRASSCAARLSRERGGDFSVCAMLLLIAAIGTTWMACDEGRQAFTPPRGPFSLHPLVALVLGFVSGSSLERQRPGVERRSEKGARHDMEAALPRG